jgi:hypothetical protein
LVEGQFRGHYRSRWRKLHRNVIVFAARAFAGIASSVVATHSHHAIGNFYIVF